MFRRFVLLTAGLALVLVLALAAFAYWFLAGDGVRTSLESQATKWLGQSVRIGSASAQIFPRPAITLHDVRAGDPARLVLADIHMRLKEWDGVVVQLDDYLDEYPLASNRIRVRSVRNAAAEKLAKSTP